VESSGGGVTEAPTFSANWSGARDYWAAMFQDLGWVGLPGLRFLEVGCFEGRCSLWMLENVLTDPTAALVAVDTFLGSPEFPSMGINGDSRARFDSNVEIPIKAGKVTVIQGKSQQVLRDLPAAELFEFVYIDGSHSAPDILTDAVLAWPLLRVGGVLAFDDYEWGTEKPDRPALAIDAFLACFADQLRIRERGYQVAVEKL
jgi:hypothetical protein